MKFLTKREYDLSLVVVAGICLIHGFGKAFPDDSAGVYIGFGIVVLGIYIKSYRKWELK